MTAGYYRKDIDGLRAIAVCAVLFYHLGFSSISGGFVGVDIFFVISGYLITQIILRQAQKNQFSYSDFYTRRVKRLMPALFSTILFSSIAAVFILLPNDLESFSSSAATASFAFSNMFFWRTHGGYFGGNSQDVPLLHTWSLGVEEQFYFIWPALILLAFRYRGWIGIYLLIIASFLVSLILSEYIVRTTFGAAYYLMPTRFFELSGGALLGALAINREFKTKALFSNLIALGGLVLIFTGMFALDKSSSFPGTNALIPVLGTMALIYAGDQTFVAKMLSIRPAVFLGKISYSLYLVHWPIIVFTQYIGIKLTLSTSLALLLSAIILGYLQWRFVENRFRFSSFNTKRKTITFYFIIPALLTCAFAASIHSNTGFPNRFSENVQSMDQAFHSKPAKERAGCHSPRRDYQVLPSDNCFFGAPSSAQVNALLIGDSHANHLTGFIGSHGADEGVTIRDYTMDSCMPLYFDIPEADRTHNQELCFTRNKLAYKHLEQTSYDFVIVAGLWPHNEAVYTQKEMYDALLQLFKKIKQSGSAPILMLDVPGVYGSDPKCPIKREAFGFIESCRTERQKRTMGNVFMSEIALQLKTQIPDLRIIDPSRAVCDNDGCYPTVNGIPLYLDVSHMNHVGSTLLGKKYLREFGNIFAHE